MKFSLMILCLFLSSCNYSNQETHLKTLFGKWLGQKIIFPNCTRFSSLSKDEALDLLSEKRDYLILSYVDSTGCTNCKMQLNTWKDFLNKKDSLLDKKVMFALIIHPFSSKKVVDLLKDHHFDYPVCIDEQDSLNILNHFPSDPRFQTFLLDKNNRVVAIGNPVHNPKVKELYMKIIKGEKELQSSSVAPQTQVSLNTASLDLGTFSSAENQKGIFQLKNTGNKPLVINAVTTSCGCTQVAYEKQPISPGGTTHLTVNYKADHPEHFNKTIVVHCNAKESPIQLIITGDAR